MLGLYVLAKEDTRVSCVGRAAQSSRCWGWVRDGLPVKQQCAVALYLCKCAVERISHEWHNSMSESLLNYFIKVS